MTREVATASLSICESMLLALEGNGTFTKVEVRDLLTDAANAHANQAIDIDDETDAENHRVAARLIERIRDQGNSVRRS